MTTNLSEALARPRRAPDPRLSPSAAWRPSLRLLAVITVALLTLGLAGVRADALPRTLPNAGGPLGRGAAAAAVTSQVAAPAGQDPLRAVPAGFASVMGYTPVPVRTADGIVRLAEPGGACSVPGVPTPFGFEQVCRTHDYGYDLLRYAAASGQVLSGEARRQLDGAFRRDLHASCEATGNGLAEFGCHTVAEVFATGVAVNSWRQRFGNPAEESLPRWALGVPVLALTVPLLPRLRRRARRSAGRTGARLRALADATPAGRDRYVDFLRVVSIVTVVLGHWTMTAVSRSADGLAAGNVLSSTPWLWLATWMLQVMPVFFVVGGFSNMASWQAQQRRGGGYVEYLSGRMARLLRPVLVFAGAWLVLPLLLDLAGLPGEQVGLVAKVMAQPLWFLGVYLVVVALAPVMVRLHRRWRLWVPATLAAAAAGVDALRLGAGIEQVGYLNLLLVWTLVQQVGFFYADGTLLRLSRRALVGLGAAGLAGMAVLTGVGPYPPSMVGLPGEASNMSPPTVCIVALTVWQVAIVLLARDRVSAWLTRRGPWTAVIAVGSSAMTLYLWHITAMVALYGLVVAVGGPLPQPGTWPWWATRPLWLALLAAVLVPLALPLSRFERPGRVASPARPVETPAGRPAAVLGLVLATLGLLGFVASGFAPLLGGGRLLALPVSPLQSMADLALGAYLAAAARSGATSRPLPWLLTAAGSAVPLALPFAGPAGVAVHGTVTALALAATRHEARAGALPMRPWPRRWGVASRGGGSASLPLRGGVGRGRRGS
jgi:fucose 4-O-acetylase-like acetyltransferase